MSDIRVIDLADAIRDLGNAVDSGTRALHDVLTHDRTEREAQLVRFERGVELLSLAILCQTETFGPTGTAMPLANALDRVLRERGVLT